MAMTDYDGQTCVLAARWIFPMSSGPIYGGWIRVQDGRVVELGRGSPVPSDAHDLGDVALLPGLVNAHTHLEFSDFRQPVGEPGVPLARWIGQVVFVRGQATPEAKQRAVDEGLREMATTGTVLAGEIMTPPTRYRSAIQQQVELITFAEVLGLHQERFSERLATANQHITESALGAVSPHAPYSTSVDAIDACVALAEKFHRPLAMHVAESPDERELLSSGTGPFSETLKLIGAWRDGQFPWGDDPVGALIDRLSNASRVLLVHGNDLRDDEIDRLKQLSQFTVVYCPRTHQFFRYGRHPVDRLIRAGVRVALGTDSRASNPDLNLWREVQFLLAQRPDLSPGDVLRMATIHGAEALGRTDLGRIEPGTASLFGTVRTDADTEERAYEDMSTNDFNIMNLPAGS